MGIYSFLGVIRSLNLDPVLFLRINQLAYVFFVGLSGPFIIRFAFEALKSPIPKIFKLMVDGLSILIIFISLGPFVFKGYFSYSFGFVPAGTMTVNLIVTWWSLINFYILLTWYKKKKN